MKGVIYWVGWLVETDIEMYMAFKMWNVVR